MKCARCGNDNPEGARFCNSCGCALTDHRPGVRVSRMAIASSVCALLALACFVPGLVATLDPAALDPRSGLVRPVTCVSDLLAAVAFVLGIVALCLIGSSGGRLTGYGFAAIGAVIPPILIFLLFWFNVGGRWSATISPRMVCGTNLSGIGKAMLMYSRDYDDEFPRAGGPDGRWSARLPWWAADNARDAYGLSEPNAADGRASVSASLYLLVKYAEVTPKSFICKGDYRTTEFRPAKYGVGDRNLIDLWDFGPEPWRHCSYAYHMPYGPYALTTSCDPALAVAADRNPWIDSPFEKAKDFSLFNPDVAPFNGTKEDAKQGNAVAHGRDGQNVLFLDSHVEFTERPYRRWEFRFDGKKLQRYLKGGDNIYTYWNGEDKIRGKTPKLGSQPADRLDSLLVNDPAIPR